MNNELYFLRSCHLRLPITASFVDEFGNQVRSPEEVGQFAVRNRADRCFQKIESNLNGFRSIRNPDDLAWEEYLCTDDEYGLALPNDGIGVPVNTIQVSSASEVGRQQVRKIGSAPIAMSIPSEENPNFATRARIFAESWNYDKARWEGDVTIPVEVGPHRPFSTKKAVRTKFVPFIGTEQLRFEFKKNRAEFDSGLATDHMPVAKMLFEQSNRFHQAARDAPINRFVGETDPFCLWFADDHVFMIVPHDAAQVLGQDSNGCRGHADVCARFPPGSTMEFDSVQFAATGQTAGLHSFAADWASQPYKVFRIVVSVR